MTTPSITGAQVTAFLTWAASLAVAFGVHLTQLQQTSIIGGASFFAAAIVAGDAIIRHGRSRALSPPNVLQTSNAMGSAVPAGAPSSADPPPPATPASSSSGAQAGV